LARILRRRDVLALLAGALGTAVGPFRADMAHAGLPVMSGPERHLKSVLALGKAARAERKLPDDLPRLASEAGIRLTDKPIDGLSMLRRAIFEANATDFALGDIVVVNGLVMGRTEARVFALLSMLIPEDRSSGPQTR
jgi:hypothetical protein